MKKIILETATKKIFTEASVEQAVQNSKPVKKISGVDFLNGKGF